MSDKPRKEEEKQIKGDLIANCQKAAEWLRNGDILLVSTGAGMSADSGLGVYKDVGKIPAYKEKGLDYGDLSRPTWIEDAEIEAEREFFYGFWGEFINAYRETSPHSGYKILKKLKDYYFGNYSYNRYSKRVVNSNKNKSDNTLNKSNNLNGKKNSNANLNGLNNNIFTIEVINEIKQETNKEDERKRFQREFSERLYDDLLSSFNFGKEELKQRVKPIGPFYIYTSNVDAHSEKSGFNEQEVYEIHGTSEEFQCVENCCDISWEIPRDFRFVVDTRSRMAPNIPSTLKLSEASFETYLEEILEGNRTGIGGNYPRERLRFGVWSYLPPALLPSASSNGLSSSASLKELKEEKVNEENDNNNNNNNNVDGNRRSSARLNKKKRNSRKFLPNYSDNNNDNLNSISSPNIMQSDGENEVKENIELTTEQKNQIKEKAWKIWNSFSSNHPSCIECGKYARPHILMFSDTNFSYPDHRDRLYYHWRDLAMNLAQQRNKKIIILEIGCGIRVPTVRMQSENLFTEIDNAYLIRVNLDFPLLGKNTKEDVVDWEDRFLPIMANAEDALRLIDYYMSISPS